MATLLNLGTIIAVAEETTIGGGKATAWADTDVVSFNDDSGLTPATDSITRNVFNGSFIACKSLTGQESTSGSLNTEVGITTVTGSEAGKLKGHLLWKAGLGIYVEQGADTTVANTISEEADPVTNPTGYDLYKLSKPDDARTTLCVREYLGGTNNVIEHKGVVVDSISLTLTAGQIATASFSVSGIAYNIPTGQPVLTNLGCGSMPFVTKLAVLKIDNVLIPAQDLTLNINNTNTDRNAITSTGISDKVITAKSVDLSYTVDLEDLSAYTKLKNNTDGAVYIELTNGAEEIRIYLPKVSYNSLDLGTDGGVKTLSINAMATADANGEAIYIATKK